jgi:ribosomal protein S18 acetylase RimI-like enzyme
MEVFHFCLWRMHMENAPSIHFSTFRPGHALAFDRLNRAWLVQYGLLEAADEPTLTDPEGSILAKGGQIFVALQGTTVVGTCALIPVDDGTLELAKLAVAPEAKGRGLGKQLVETALAHAQQTGVHKVILLSSSRLTTAVRLYESLGFCHAPMPNSQPYATADVFMELDMATYKPPLCPWID